MANSNKDIGLDQLYIQEKDLVDTEAGEFTTTSPHRNAAAPTFKLGAGGPEDGTFYDWKVSKIREFPGGWQRTKFVTFTREKNEGEEKYTVKIDSGYDSLDKVLDNLYFKDPLWWQKTPFAKRLATPAALRAQAEQHASILKVLPKSGGKRRKTHRKRATHGHKRKSHHKRSMRKRMTRKRR
jgi:hypothetical protein